MSDALETHLRYDALDHKADCKRPAFEIEYRQTTGRRNYPASGHKCTAGQTDEDGYDCDHGNSFSKTVLRVICRSCEQAYRIDGESVSLTSIDLDRLDVDLHPRRTAGLYLYNGPCKNLYNGNPEWVLAAHAENAGHFPVAEQHVAGAIFCGFTKRGAVEWSAVAGLVVDPKQPYNDFFRHSWVRRSADQKFRSLTAAAKWIAEQSAELRAESAETGQQAGA
ncbi:hypothetical protein [Kitasatospora sp. NPDC002965]|uniref:hypothetical protein n=1 Tax=Kitasatospora sp. NPDC002965 TaxID=3154775 RepID=UPI0033BD3692